MKHIYLLILLLPLLVSCTIEDETADTNWEVITVTINSTDWNAYTDGESLNLYYAEYADLPELTSFIYSSGLVQVYYVEEYATDATVQHVLPYVRHYENGVSNWTTTVDYDYEVGNMTFYVTNSDFANTRPDKMEFRIVMMW